MPIALTVAPNAAAFSLFERKRATATDLTSTQIEGNIPHYAREVAFFTARLNDAKKVTELKTLLTDALAMPPEKAFVDRAAFIADARKALGATEGDSGQLTDITSQRRLGLVYDTNIESVYNAARAEQESLHPELLDEYPAQELIRVEAREKERDWSTRWQAAGGKFYAGRMIALKNDSVWRDISRFENPWPPFDYGSCMGVEDIDREECIALGLIKPDFKFPRDEKPYTNNMWEMSQSAKGVDGETIEFLKEHFAGALKIVPPSPEHPNGTIVLTPQKLQMEAIRAREQERLLKSLPSLQRDKTFEELVSQNQTLKDSTGTLITTNLAHLDNKSGKDRTYRKAFLPAALEAIQTVQPADELNAKGEETKVYKKTWGTGSGEIGVKSIVSKDGTFFNYVEFSPKNKAAPKGGKERADLRATKKA